MTARDAAARESLVVGVDVGTSSTKAVVWGASAGVLGRGAARYEVTRSPAGRAEQDPEDWWRALARAVRQAVHAAACAPEQIKALAISAQGGTLVPLERDLRPARPAILWSDKRASAEGALAVETLGPDYVSRTTGWHLSGGLNLLQLRWLARHEPESFSTTRWFCSIPDYLSLKLCGVPVLDPSQAGINQLADFRRAEWDDRLLDFAGVNCGQLAEIRAAAAPVGPISRDAAEFVGLEPGTMLVNGGHDQYCMALGTGVATSGTALIGAGTAWTVVALSERAPEPGASRQAFSRHVVPGLFGRLLSLGAGGDSLEWCRRLVTASGASLVWPPTERELPTSPWEFPLYFPYLHGSPYPHQPDARGALLGLDPAHGPYELAAAVMAGVAFQAVWMLEAFTEEGPHEVVVSGGATRNTWWMRALASVAPVPVRLSREPEPGCVGAALLAAHGCGLVGSLADWRSPGSVTVQDVSSSAWGERYEQFKTHGREILTTTHERNGHAALRDQGC